MNSVFLLFIWIIILAGFVGWFKFKLPIWKGRLGERFVNKKLLELDSLHYKVLDDLLLPSIGNTATTQIDHVVVSNYGIFCIETKDYAGWIFGDTQQEYWTQVIYRTKNRFYNPLRQNYAHTKAIEILIKPLFPNILIIPFIIFPSAKKLKISGTDSVGNGTDTVSKIRSYRNFVLSDVDRDKIYEILLKADIKGDEARKSHLMSARAIKGGNPNV
jgi:hypothetical protein